jgi:hypothetical protein
MPIYWGAPEAKELFGEDSYVPIDIKNIRGSIEIIEKLLDSDPYESRLEALNKSKAIVTDQLNFLSRMLGILQNPRLPLPGSYALKNIKPLHYFSPGKNILDAILPPFVSILDSFRSKYVRGQ